MTAVITKLVEQKNQKEKLILFFKELEDSGLPINKKFKKATSVGAMGKQIISFTAPIANGEELSVQIDKQGKKLFRIWLGDTLIVDKDEVNALNAIQEVSVIKNIVNDNAIAKARKKNVSVQQKVSGIDFKDENEVKKNRFEELTKENKDLKTEIEKLQGVLNGK